ncbi:hypothetical protein QBC41DRAFT_318495 [Cercophora samala]|uniref:Uncharacterized protein n=1 Tax=Cercophora samala TaxID=330535 RepID=A0AA39ZFK9_9PEZI|nr:hypothetical protein QBC41DRAFT_318495 [Cercophora samala]
MKAKKSTTTIPGGSASGGEADVFPSDGGVFYLTVPREDETYEEYSARRAIDTAQQIARAKERIRMGKGKPMVRKPPPEWYVRLTEYKRLIEAKEEAVESRAAEAPDDSTSEEELGAKKLGSSTAANKQPDCQATTRKSSKLPAIKEDDTSEEEENSEEEEGYVVIKNEVVIKKEVTMKQELDLRPKAIIKLEEMSSSVREFLKRGRQSDLAWRKEVEERDKKRAREAGYNDQH